MESVRRLPPCPEYDIEGRQAWLEDMARQGLVVTEFGKVFVYFKQTAPREIRYRLQPLLHRKDPAPAAVALAEDFGWLHLGNHGKFAFYGTEDPDARELETDPQVRAMVLKQFLRQRACLYILTLLLLLALLFPSPLVRLTKLPLWYIWLFALFLFLSIRSMFFELCTLLRLYRQAKDGQTPSQHKDWTRGRRGRSAILLAEVVLFYALFFSNYLVTYLPWETFRWKPAAEDLPFADAAETGGGDYIIGDWNMDHNNEMAARTTLLFRKQISFQQYGYLCRDGAEPSSIWFLADYYDLRTEGLAKALYRQLAAAAEPEPLADLPTEQELLYREPRPILLLRDGARVLKVMFYENQGATIPDAQWTTAAAEAFLE